MPQLLPSSDTCLRFAGCASARCPAPHTPSLPLPLLPPGSCCRAKAYWDRESLARRDDITAVVIMLRFMSEQEAEADKRATAAAALAATQSGGAGSAASGPSGAARAADPSVAGAASTAAVQVQVVDDGLPAAAAAGVGALASASQPSEASSLLVHSAGSAARHPDSAAAAHSAAASVAGAGAGTDSAVSAPFSATPSAGLPNGATPSAGAEIAHLLSASSGGPSDAGLHGSVGPALVVNGPTSTTADIESFPLSSSGELLSPPVPVAGGAVDAEAAGALLAADSAGDLSGSRRASATAASAGRVISGSLPAGDEAAGGGTGDVALRPQVLRLVSEGVQAQSLSRGITLSSHSNPGITPSMAGAAIAGNGPGSTSAAAAVGPGAAAPSLPSATR